MNQEECFNLEDEQDRIARIELTPEMYRQFESMYKITEVVTGHRRVLYDPKNTIRRRNFIEDVDSPVVWMIGDKKKAGFDYQISMLTFTDEVYDHIVRNLYDVKPEELNQSHLDLINQHDVCIFEPC